MHMSTAILESQTVYDKERKADAEHQLNSIKNLLETLAMQQEATTVTAFLILLTVFRLERIPNSYFSFKLNGTSNRRPYEFQKLLYLTDVKAKKKVN